MSNKIILVISILACAFSFGSVSEATYYVDSNGSDDANGLSWVTAFETIQKAIDTASDGNVVDVNSGTYYESIDFSGKAVSIRSLDPNDPQVVAGTVIDGNNADKVIIFDDLEDANSIISGFTVKGGGTGIYCFEASPAIYSCVIRDNNDSGIVNLKLSEPSIIDCVFYSNSARYGAGIHNFQSSPTITNCVFSQNAAGSRGGGIYNSFSSPTIINCTFSGNTASTSAGGMFSSISSAVVKNSVFWDNSAGYSGNEIYNDNSDPNFSYCVIEGCKDVNGVWDPNFGANDGGNIDSNPWFLNTNNPLGSDNIFNTVDDGLRLKSNSSCIDAADGNSAPSSDITGQSRVDISSVENTGTGEPNYADIGVDEFSGDSDNDGMPDDWENFYGLDPNTNDADNHLDADGYSNLSEYLHSSDPNDNNSVPSVNIIINVPNDVNTIQRAINTAIDGDTIIAAEGTYYEKINYNGISCTLQSIDPNDSNVVAATIIDANDTSFDVVTFSNGEDVNSVIKGFTITGGDNGISCTSVSSPLIRDCNITGNNSSGIYTSGSSSPAIIDSTINNNNRHGIYLYSGNYSTISGCTITENGSPGSTGHGIYVRTSGAPTIENCIISSNSGISSTGISCYSGCSPKINNCTINNNASVGISLGQNNSSANISGCEINSNVGGGVYSGISGTYIAISNSVISKNSGYGLNIRDNDSSVTNCTIAGNTSYGIIATTTFDNIKNCIIWSNNNNDDLYNSDPTFSAIGESHSGIGNFTVNDPCFIDYTNNDFHLKSSSSICIDAGEPWADYSLEPSPNGNRINLGAYGNTSEAAVTTDVDSDGLSDAWEEYYFGDINSYDDANNPDADDFNNMAEFLFGYDPCAINNDMVAIFNPTLSTAQIDPTLNETLTVGYWLNMDASVDVNFFTAGEIVRTISTSASAGYNDTIWDGKDDASEIVENDTTYSISIDANDNDGNTVNIAAGSVDVIYTHAINNLLCNPYRIIPMNNEVSKITYDITVDATMIVTVYDPCGVHFITLRDDIFPVGTSQEVIWYGKDGDPDDPDSRYITKEGAYLVEVKFKGMREKAQDAVTAYK